MLSELIGREMYSRHRRTYPAFLFAICMVSTPVRLASAQSTELPQGARVRVDVGPVLVGVLVGARNDTLLILTRENRDTTAVALTAVRSLEVSTRRNGHAVKGAAVGLAIGAISGFAVAAAVGSPRADGPVAGSNTAQALGILGGVGASAGAAVGAVVGSLFRTDRWEPVVYPHFGLSPGAPATQTFVGIRYRPNPHEP
jgi:hypothetical protein